MYLGADKKAPGTAYRQTECTGCPQGSPKGFPALILTQRAGNLHIKVLSLSKTNLRKKEVNRNGIFYNSGNRCEL